MEPITVMTMVDEHGNEIKPKYEKGYILLMYLQGLDDTDEVHEFAIVRGRDEVVNTIFYDYISLYSIDPFKSVIMSEDTPPKRAIPIYVFVRMMLEQNKLSQSVIDRLTKDFDILDVESFNDFVEQNFYNEMATISEEGVIDLNVYYKDALENREIEIG